MSEAPERLKNKVAIARLINGLQDNDYESSLIIADAIIDEIPPTREQIMADPRVMALVEILETITDRAEFAKLHDNDVFNFGWMIPKSRTALAALTDNEGETE